MDLSAEMRLACALLQLTIYIETLRLPFSLQDLYLLTYGELWEEMPGALWLHHLAEDPYVVAGLDEFYTLQTIFQIIEQAGLALLLEVIAEETERIGIGMGVIRPGTYRRRPPDEDHGSP